MNSDGNRVSIAQTVTRLLPYLRRYARALTGDQPTGDRYAVATLDALLVDRSVFEEASSPRVALFHAFHRIWASSGEPVSGEDQGIAARAQRHLRRLTPNTREVLLLSTIEEFTRAEIAEIIDGSLEDVNHLLAVAMREMEASVSGRIMIIEDEAIIALDLQTIIAEMGHALTGVASTRADAVKLAAQARPDLILSDIQLADGSSGIDAVNEIFAASAPLPVIFITAFPERLLTGDRPEPAFVITKPYTEDQIRSAVSQAMFFASTESLTV